ncbi:uncharacterized protein [Acropora muricata]|uniref:uncharacterized protein isoform X4 n=1 Tax=Acropora muricata TaxID=159855 RepID=UPI0034E55328
MPTTRFSTNLVPRLRVHYRCKGELKDGGSLTWEQPLPIQTVQSSNPVDHFSSRQFHEGTINATLNWRFRLNQLNFGSLVISLNGTHIAGIGSSGSGSQAGFENEYGIDWNANQKLVKLFIFNVTTEKNGTFTCQVNVDEVTGFVTKNFQLRSAVQVHVVVSPKVTLRKKFFVGREQTASLFCQVEGNPKPTISWSPCDPPHVSCDKQYLNISKVQTALSNYNCTARNAVGIDSATTELRIGGYSIYLKMAIIEECDKKDSVWEALKKEFTNVFEKNTTESYSGAELINLSCGSLIFDVVLNFSTEVAEDDSISLIQNAIVDGKLGELSVWYIIGTPPHSIPMTTPLTLARTTPKCGESYSSGYWCFHCVFYGWCFD